MYAPTAAYLPSRRSISVAKVLESTTSRRGGARNNRSNAYGRTTSLDRNTGKFQSDGTTHDCDRSGWDIRSTILDRTLRGGSEASLPSAEAPKPMVTTASAPASVPVTASSSSKTAAAAIEALRSRSKSSNAINVSESMRQTVGGSSATFEASQKQSDFHNRFKTENDFSALSNLQNRKSSAELLATSGTLKNSSDTKERQTSSFSLNLEESKTASNTVSEEKSERNVDLSKGRESLAKDASTSPLSFDKFESHDQTSGSKNGTISHSVSKEGKLMEIEELSEDGSVRANSPNQDEEAAEFKERVVKAPEVPKELRSTGKRIRRAVSSDLSSRSESMDKEWEEESGRTIELKRAESETNLSSSRRSRGRSVEISRFPRDEDGRRSKTKVVIVREDEQVDEEFHSPIIDCENFGIRSSDRSQQSSNTRKAGSRSDRREISERDALQSTDRIFSARVPKPKSTNGRTAVKVVWDEDGSVVRSGCSRVKHQPWEDNCWGNHDRDEDLERARYSTRSRYDEESPGKVMVARKNGSKVSRQSSGTKERAKNGVVIVRDPMVNWSRSAHQEDDEALGRTIHLNRSKQRSSSEDNQRGIQIVREPLAHRRSHIDFDNFDTLASSLTADIDALSPVQLPRALSPSINIVREPLARRIRTNSGESVLSEHSLKAENDAILSALRLASSRDCKSNNWRDLSPEGGVTGGVTAGWQESRTVRPRESRSENGRLHDSRNESRWRDSRSDKDRSRESRSENGRLHDSRNESRWRESCNENGRSWESRFENGFSRESRNENQMKVRKSGNGGRNNNYNDENGYQDSRFERRFDDERRTDNGWHDRQNGNRQYHEQWIENGGWPESRNNGQRSQESKIRISKTPDQKVRRSKSQPVTIVREPMAFRYEEGERDFDSQPQPRLPARKKLKRHSASRSGPVTIIRESQSRCQTSRSIDWERSYDDDREEGLTRSRSIADQGCRFVTFDDDADERQYRCKVNDYER